MIERVAPTVPIYRQQRKREQRLYVVPTKNKITHMPFDVKPAEEYRFDNNVDKADVFITLGLGIFIVGCISGLAVYHLGFTGVVILLGLVVAVWGIKGLWRELA